MNERKRSLASRYKRDVLSMMERELKVAAALDGRLKNADTLTVDQLRERVLKWMFSKNLSMKHQFVFEEVDGELYILMGKTCICCEGEQNGKNDAPDSERVRYTSTTSSSNDGEVNIEALPTKSGRSPSIPTIFIPKSMIRTSGRQTKIAPAITEQPKPQQINSSPSAVKKEPVRTDEKNKKKKGEEEEEGSKCCCCQLYRECVLSFMNMC
ncbi:hypothetical protein PFISCL1PPCAC_28663 [Pristionchus fissidentatus]|uniref:Uncharacterized protein n=1 Tax=Pristionchus fissidentatus TaxID=1538716 RepID=A0AAV5WY86_9BILA|nr:hypothetical protein PFISCL1PPCAC_11454 [Pristionchus fissidentatus]GMT37366.1 hypothetical protein PFISCL1PPCAC_28663 [Pristionchus fissidentatus]